jgi:hypothetical protein
VLILEDEALRSSINLKRNEMPRISTYTKDTTVEKTDKLIGSNANGTTANFSIEDISRFFRETNAAGIAAQFGYQYNSSGNGTFTPTFSSGSTFANLTSVKVNKYTYGETDSSENLLAVLSGKDVIIVDIENQNNFGVYTAGTPTQDGSTDFYDISLSSVQNSNGSITEGKFYSMIAYGGGADKTVSLTFAPGNFVGYPSPSTETINGSPLPMKYIDWEHDLGKYPAITVTESFSTTGMGFVPFKYISASVVRVYFTGTTNGVIYAN